MLGDAHDALQRGDQAEAERLAQDPAFNLPAWAEVDSPLEAAVATGCSCLSNHAPALSNNPLPPFLPPHPWKPSDDQADGEEG